MSNFDLAIPIVLKNEGGFVNDPDDAGGATNFGISLRFLQSIDKDASIATIKNMSREQACFIYRKEFWDKGNFAKINDQDIANKAFDFAVNMGINKAVKLLQNSLNNVYLANELKVDGVLGEKTLELVNNSSTCQRLTLAYLVIFAIKHYNSLIDSHPSYIKFLHGWINRALA